MRPLVDLLFGLPYWASLAILALALLTIVELGFRLGRRQEKKDASTRSTVGALVAALLTLLGLLLGFSFSMVESRFSARKSIVIEEANAIGTAYLRAKLLPAPHGQRIQQELRHYVDLRLQPVSPGALERAIRASEISHRRLWAEMTAVAATDPRSEIVGRALSALNNVIDLHTTRLTVVLHQRLPTPIMTVLLLIAILSAGLLGYWVGLERQRSLAAVVAVIAAYTLAIVMVAEIDDPGAPLFEVSQSAMRDLRSMMAADE